MTIEKTIKNYAKIKKQFNELKATLTDIENAVKDYMTDNGLNKATIDGYNISYTEYNKMVFDSKRFQTDCVELYQEYQKETHTSRLSIKF